MLTFSFLLGLVGIVPASTAQPHVSVSNIRRVFDNGEHNAFTDMIRFRDRYYLTFRNCPDGHMLHPTSSIIVLSSTDTREWKPVHRFSVPLRDVRDPHFLVFEDKLFVYSGTWYCGEGSPDTRDMNEQLGYGVWTSDGENWSDPILLEGTYGHYIWRAAAYDGKAWLCGRRKHGFARTTSRADWDRVVESALLVSEDGLTFRTAGLFQETYGDETAFLFEEDGSITAVARSRANRNAQVCLAKPPYREWSRVNLDRYIGGPVLAKWDGRYVVGGRKMVNGTRRTSLYWLIDKNRLEEFAELPSDGDNSYPGFIALSPTRALVSWYSSHEKNPDSTMMTAIYLADLELK